MKQLLYLITILSITLLLLISIVGAKLEKSPLAKQITNNIEKVRTK